MDARVQLVVCFLCTDFCNTIIWESWRSDDDEKSEDAAKIGFVSHPRPEYRYSIPYSVQIPAVTQWGDSSLVRAEILLLLEALERFPNARQFLIVSGDTVPIRTKDHQFIALSRHHARYLVSPVGRHRLARMNSLVYESPRRTANFSPDEVYIQTILANTFPAKEFYDHRFVEIVAEGRHAKTLTIDEFKSLYADCMECETLYCIRNVSKKLQWGHIQIPE